MSTDITTPIIKLTSSDDTLHHFNITGIDDVKRAVVPSNITKGKIFDIYYAGGNKVGGIWQGDNINDYLTGELERAIIASNDLVKKPAVAIVNI